MAPIGFGSGIFLQNACLQHRFIRSKDTSNIVERPERLRAVNIGLAAAIARLEEVLPAAAEPTKEQTDPNDLADAMNRMKLGTSALKTSPTKIPIIQSQATVDILNHPAVKFIHGDVEGDVYLETLKAWVNDSAEKITRGESEIPEGYSQGDLYLCPESLKAMEGSVGTICEAIDSVIEGSRGETTDTSIQRAFVAVRPPGHHCGEDTPSGFCFINNVAVGAAHAHLQHGINRIVILDIDLHHGNGTQSIAWQINEETYRQTLEQEAGASPEKPGAQVYYGSIHDILSYPCENGKLELIQAASVSIHKSHGQHIENVHLQTYTSEDHFWDTLYKEQYSKILSKAEAFLNETGGPGDDVLIFISCGMDACEHEYQSMSRHNRKVPTSFYYRFARDACALSDNYASGRIVSVLEGGYSDRALISGSMAHLSGLVDVCHPGKVDECWWSVENLEELEKATKKRRGGRPSLPASGSTRTWIDRTLEIFAPLDTAAAAVSSSLRSLTPVPPMSMNLRDRSKGKATTPTASPSSARTRVTASKSKVRTPTEEKEQLLHVPVKLEPTSSSSSTENESERTGQTKKLPKVILRLGKAPDSES